MAAEPKVQIPVLTDEFRTGRISAHKSGSRDNEALIAELQTQLAANTFALTDEIMRKAFAEMEASVFEQISGRLRRELPEMVDALLREHLGDEPEY
jgi:hypothetical protein